MLAYITPSEAGTLKDLGGQETMTPEGIPAYPPPGEYGGPGYTGRQETNRERGIRTAAQSYSAPSPSPSGTGRQDPMGSGYYDTPEGRKQLADQSKRIEEMRERGEGIFADEPPKSFIDTVKEKVTTFPETIRRRDLKRNLDYIIKGRKIDFPLALGIFKGPQEEDEFYAQFAGMSPLEMKAKYNMSDTDIARVQQISQVLNQDKITQSQFEEAFYGPKGPPDLTGGGDGPQPIVYPYPTSTAMAPTAVAPEATAIATAPANPFLPGGNLPFSTYGTAAHGAQFGVDQRMFAADGGRIGYAGGGITDLRQGYFLGKLVKKIGKGIKKVVKSPIGKAALLAAPFAFQNKTGIGKIIRDALFGKALPYKTAGDAVARSGGLLNFLQTGRGAMTGIAALSSLPLLFGSSEEEDEKDYYADATNIFNTVGSPDELRARALRGELPQNEFPFQSYYAADGGRVGLMGGGNIRAAALNQLYGINDDEDKKLSKGGSAGLPPITQGVETQASQSFSDDETPMPTQPDQMPRPRPMPNPMMMAGRMNPMMARGMMPRMMAQEGGLMDMGGMEKDYRNEGGFVPIGGQERADDVPARLSKNEFVFTADAVRNAGGGDIDKGAEVMENMMENLEKGGKVSEESQGLKGARDMFATAQRLEGVL